jgi:hypothetical protein
MENLKTLTKIDLRGQMGLSDYGFYTDQTIYTSIFHMVSDLLRYYTTSPTSPNFLKYLTLYVHLHWTVTLIVMIGFNSNPRLQQSNGRRLHLRPHDHRNQLSLVHSYISFCSCFNISCYFLIY